MFPTAKSISTIKFKCMFHGINNPLQGINWSIFWGRNSSMKTVILAHTKRKQVDIRMWFIVRLTPKLVYLRRVIKSGTRLLKSGWSVGWVLFSSIKTKWKLFQACLMITGSVSVACLWNQNWFLSYSIKKSFFFWLLGFSANNSAALRQFFLFKKYMFFMLCYVVHMILNLSYLFVCHISLLTYHTCVYNRMKICWYFLGAVSYLLEKM